MKRIATVAGPREPINPRSSSPIVSPRAAAQQCPLLELQMSVANSLVRNFLLATLGYNQVEDVFWLLVGCWLSVVGCWLLVVWLFGLLVGWILLVLLLLWLLVLVATRIILNSIGDPGIPMNLPTIYLGAGTSQYIWAYVFLGLIPRMRWGDHHSKFNGHEVPLLCFVIKKNNLRPSRRV